jgi:hypothetical protein
MTISLRWPALALAVAATLAGTAPAAEKIVPKDRDRIDPAQLARTIDEAVTRQLTAEKVAPAPRADDAEFLRRAYLDLTGVIPPADKAAAFLDSRDPDKRAKLIDDLLADPRFGRHMADIWQALLVQHDADNRRIQFDPLGRWLEEKFNKDTPWDQFVTDLVTASGTQDENGAVTFFLANLSPDKVNDRVSRTFLGVHLQCAQCHNHPFTKWKQTDYWGMAAFFMRVSPGGNVNKMAKDGSALGVSENASGKGRTAKLPESAKVVPAKFFLGEEAKVKAGEPYRPVLAAWLTAKDNPYFARALVNRVWGQLFGRGFTNPVDDFRDDNPVSHPELLRELSAQFAAGGFDVKDLFRAICNSQAYQRTSKPSAAGDDADLRLFGRMAIKPLTPEELYDSLELVLGKSTDRAERPRNGAKVGPVTPRTAFVNFFQVDETADPTEYQAGIPQALRLMNAPQMNRADGVLRSVDRSGSTAAQVVERLYLATLSRRPEPAEGKLVVDYVTRHGEKPRDAYGDVLWALLNSSEFTLNH